MYDIRKEILKFLGRSYINLRIYCSLLYELRSVPMNSKGEISFFLFSPSFSCPGQRLHQTENLKEWNGTVGTLLHSSVLAWWNLGRKLTIWSIDRLQCMNSAMVQRKCIELLTRTPNGMYLEHWFCYGPWDFCLFFHRMHKWWFLCIIN